MRTLVWSNTFVRAYKRILRRQPELPERIEQTLKALIQDPFHPQLHSHKLKGDLGGTWACTVSYDLRILFEFIQNKVSNGTYVGGTGYASGTKQRKSDSGFCPRTLTRDGKVLGTEPFAFADRYV